MKGSLVSKIPDVGQILTHPLKNLIHINLAGTQLAAVFIYPLVADVAADHVDDPVLTLIKFDIF
jgi:hypothetical protein